MAFTGSLWLLPVHYGLKSHNRTGKALFILSMLQMHLNGIFNFSTAQSSFYWLFVMHVYMLSH
jgi:hypothetical membrane protein